MENLEVLEGQLDIFGVAAKSDKKLIELLADRIEINARFIKGARFEVNPRNTSKDKYCINLNGSYYEVPKHQCKEVI